MKCRFCNYKPPVDGSEHKQMDRLISHVRQMHSYHAARVWHWAEQSTPLPAPSQRVVQ